MDFFNTYRSTAMFGLMETVFPFLFITIFVIVIGVFIAAAVRLSLIHI